MAKKRFTVDQRGRVAEKIMELGNLVFIGLAISQIISGPPFRLMPAIAGVVCLLVAYKIADWIMRGGGKLWR